MSRHRASGAGVPHPCWFAQARVGLSSVSALLYLGPPFLCVDACSDTNSSICPTTLVLHICAFCIPVALTGTRRCVRRFFSSVFRSELSGQPPLTHILPLLASHYLLFSVSSVLNSPSLPFPQLPTTHYPLFFCITSFFSSS